MAKILRVALVLIAAFFILNKNVWAVNEAVSSAGLILARQDERIEKLNKFFKNFDSPLSPYARNFVETADRYQLDWRLIPAISGVESTFGKFIPKDSYNAYGWANGDYYFNSWEQSIEIVAKTLKENYLDRGADTVEEIAPIYAPPSTTWTGKVNFFMDQIENFKPKDTLALELSL